MKLVIRPQFYLDLQQEIENLAERAGAATAVRWHGAVERTVNQLTRHPYMGRCRADVNFANVRSWRVEQFRRWLIFYQVREDILVLLRVRYGMMDLPALDYES
jgi:plasmid stabilization system protein ParE